MSDEDSRKADVLKPAFEPMMGPFVPAAKWVRSLVTANWTEYPW